MRLIIMLGYFLLPSIVASVDIDNFKSGLACSVGGNVTWICHQTTTIYITGQGLCVYDFEELPCTWFGFEFDYSNLAKNEKINCILTFSDPVRLGNPKETSDSSVKTQTFELPLTQNSGHFFNPQYSIIKLVEEGEKKTTNTVCFSGGKELFQYTNTYVYPKSP